MAWFFRNPCPSGRLVIGESEYAVAEDGLISPDLSEEHQKLAARSPAFESREIVQIKTEAPKPKPKRRKKQASKK